MTAGRPATRYRQFLAYVTSTIKRDGVAPSYGMICEALGLRSRTRVNELVRYGEAQGDLRRVGAGRVRRIRLV